MDIVVPYLLSLVRITLPYALCASAGLLCQRAGIENLALEGLVLCAAFTSTVVVLASKSVALSVLLTVAVTVLLSLLFARSVLRWTGEAVLLGIAFNLLVAGATRFMLKVLYDSASNSPAIAPDLETHVTGYLMLVALHAWLSRTVASRRVLAAGSTPLALQAQGLSVDRYRYIAFALAGVLLSWAGLDLAFGQQRFTDGMTAGRGYIAVAAVVFGRKRLGPTLGICGLFAATEALQIRLQNQSDGGLIVPTQLVQALPYLCCLVALVVRGRTKAETPA